MQEKAKELVVRYFNEHRDVTDSEELTKKRCLCRMVL